MKNYKTTIAGFFVALLNLIANGVSVRQALFSSSMLMLGLMAKDYDLRGGTRVADTNITSDVITKANANDTG